VRIPGRHSDLPTADPYLPGHGDRSWSASRYDLELRYDIGNNQLRGRATIAAVAEQDLERVVLDIAHLRVDKVSVDGSTPAKYSTRRGRLVLALRRPIKAGASFTMTVRYSGKPRPLVERHHGDAGWEELTDGVIVAGQPHGAPSWFPCNDRPDDKASYRISIATHPDYTVVANGALWSRTRRGATVTWVYEEEHPMATYLATVQIGRYDVREFESDVRMLVAAPSEARDGVDAAFGRQPEMLTAFTELFGPYPFTGYAVVVTADDLEIPLESQSLSTFGRNLLSDDWDSVRLVAHELAHQWFGNSVTLREWRDIWLHEGFACYAEWLWSEWSGGDEADAHARAHHERLAGLDQDLVLSDPGPDLMFDDRVYKRGALTLHAVRLTVGDEVFFRLLQGWAGENAGGSVTTADFVAYASAAAATDLDGLFRSWLDEEPLPDLPAAN